MTANEGPIRPLDRDDLAQVVELYELVMRSGSRSAPAEMIAYFERTFLDHPWFDPEIPSLVFQDKSGRIVGFLGSHVRRMCFDGRPVRLACAGQLVVDPAARRRAPGTFLLRKYLNGPQDLSITDGATEEVLQIWQLLGGQPNGVACLEWTRVFQPWRFGGDFAAARIGLRPLRRLLRPLWPLLDAVTTRLARRRFRLTPPSVRAEPLTPEALVEHLPRFTEGARLFPDYDREFAEWVLYELEAVPSRGRLVRTLVRDPDGQVLGWYVYYLLKGGVSEVIQVVAGDQGMKDVLDHLFHHAQTNGSQALQGRMEPRLLEPIHGRRAFFRYSEWALIHSRVPDILSVAGSPQGILTRLDGEWWMGHHLLGLAPGRAVRPSSAGVPAPELKRAAA